MTNALALVLVVLIAGFVLLDYVVLHLDVPLFLARKAMTLLGWLAFWR